MSLPIYPEQSKFLWKSAGLKRARSGRTRSDREVRERAQVHDDLDLLERNVGIEKYFSYVVLKSPIVKNALPLKTLLDSGEPT
jgi:hypothetical protein